MPKIVDHDERRATVLEATWRVISQQGLEAATVREIAKAAGVSNGALAHYFTNKDDVLIQAHKLAYQRVYDRVAERAAGLDTFELLSEMLHEAMPLDDERRTEALIDLSYMGRAITNPALAEVRADSMVVARGWWTDGLTAARDAGALRADLDITLTVNELLVLIDGISVQAVLYPENMRPDVQRSLVDAFLARIRA
ncbi:TetR family transcriptional regulator [Labedella phragmitis]|uniref:TetR family transcriptional regulator n=1 Tax=Labedella phragmitis TaxID=2498849 RepID=A0A3S3ZCX9_9MICO|nr:TetR/AcrR family transcriptional regulator [Labedella phragmitis]RWZ52796.1 TetR family transcriptional regulator [Labedella phragmitis]